ncbi:MAG: helix-turn-helix transcriptional regulator [Chthoniobacteraceae bacterium]
MKATYNYQSPRTKSAPANGARAEGTPFDCLTKVEFDVLGWLSKGKRNREIATIRGCGVRTVETHVEHIIEKLGVENRVVAAGLRIAHDVSHDPHRNGTER